MRIDPRPAVAIVGGGPAGLAAADALARRGVGPVIVIERDEAPGGLPRFCAHPGFGWEYTRRLESGPRFAARLLARLRGAPVTILARTSALALGEGPALSITGPDCGPLELQPRAIVLATGIRERARGPRLVPGSRPARGLLTTGLLQQLATRGLPVPGRRMVVVGTEHVAFSALLTARQMGIDVAAMIEPGARVLSFAAAALLARRVFGVPILRNTAVAEILGRTTVEGVVVDGPDGRRTIPCDCVLFTAGWVPDVALLHGSVVEIDPRTRGPAIDQLMRTSVAGVFAAGNLLRAVESSGIAAREGARAGACAAAFLAGALPPAQVARPIAIGEDLEYLVPQSWSSDGEPADAPQLRASLRMARDIARGRVVVHDGDRVLWRGSRRALLRARRVEVDLRDLSSRQGGARVSIEPDGAKRTLSQGEKAG